MKTFLKKQWCLLCFALSYGGAVLLSGWHMVCHIFRSACKLQPRIVAVPLALEHPLGINIMANLITMTPGTTSLDLSADQKVLYVYSIHAPDEAQFVLQIKHQIERPLCVLFDHDLKKIAPREEGGM